MDAPTSAPAIAMACRSPAPPNSINPLCRCQDVVLPAQLAHQARDGRSEQRARYCQGLPQPCAAIPSVTLCRCLAPTCSPLEP